MPASAIRIEQLLTVPVEHRIRQDRVVISHAGKHDRSCFLTVAAENAEGLRGYGEAATVMIWSGESAQTAAALIEQRFAPALCGHTFDHPAEALAIMDRLAVHNPFAKAAVDIALWDLWAKQQGVSVFDLFADREPVDEITTRASIGAYPTAKTIELALAFREDGVRVFKFKTGVHGADDVERLRAAREALGDDVLFTIDYNGAFDDADAAVASIEALLPFNLALVEQPTHRDRIALLAEVRKRVDVPILADECIFTPAHLADAIALDAFDIIGLYPGKNGGFTNSLRMARMAEQADKACAIGSNLDTDLGQAAMASLAAGLRAFPVDRVPCDFGSSLYYERSSVTQPLPLVDGKLRVPRGPGFGVEPVVSPSPAPQPSHA